MSRFLVRGCPKQNALPGTGIPMENFAARGGEASFSRFAGAVLRRLRRHSGQLRMESTGMRSRSRGHKIQTTTKPSDNLNYDRTTPGKMHTAAPIGRTAKYSVGSDAGRSHARLAVTTPLPGGVSALRYPTAQRPGSGRDSRNQPGRGKPEAPVGSPANERSNRTLVWGDTGSRAAESKQNDVTGSLARAISALSCFAMSPLPRLSSLGVRILSARCRVVPERPQNVRLHGQAVGLSSRLAASACLPRRDASRARRVGSAPTSPY
jgi:hypothetical protein